MCTRVHPAPSFFKPPFKLRSTTPRRRAVLESVPRVHPRRPWLHLLVGWGGSLFTVCTSLKMRSLGEIGDLVPAETRRQKHKATWPRLPRSPLPLSDYPGPPGLHVETPVSTLKGLRTDHENTQKYPAMLLARSACGIFGVSCHCFFAPHLATPLVDRDQVCVWHFFPKVDFH